MERYSNSHFREICEEYIHNQKYREILIERYCNDLTYEELSEKADMSVSQVKRICYRYGMEVFRIMEKQN